MSTKARKSLTGATTTGSSSQNESPLKKRASQAQLGSRSSNSTSGLTTVEEEQQRVQEMQQKRDEQAAAALKQRMDSYGQVVLAAASGPHARFAFTAALTSVVAEHASFYRNISSCLVAAITSSPTSKKPAKKKAVRPLVDEAEPLLANQTFHASLSNQDASASFAGSSNAASPSKPRMSHEEAQRKIVEHERAAADLRAKREARKQQQVQHELEVLDAQARDAEQLEEDRRQKRVAELKERLEVVQRRREQRELQHELSDQRMKKVLQAHNVLLSLQERQSALQREEEERRTASLLEQRRHKNHQVVSGLEEVNRLLKDAEEQHKKHLDELREHWNEVERNKPSHYQGKTYEQAMDQFVKARHHVEDDRHHQLYKKAKMFEYGRIVGQMAKLELRRGSESAPLLTSDAEIRQHHQQQQQQRHVSDPAFSSASPQQQQVRQHHGRNSLSLADRNKTGNSYLREAITNKSPLPAGLKLAPLDSPDVVLAKEIEQKKRREDLGRKYLFEVRQQNEQQGMLLTPSHQRASGDGLAQQWTGGGGATSLALSPMDERERVLSEVKQLRIKTNNMERKLMFGEERTVHLPAPSGNPLVSSSVDQSAARALRKEVAHLHKSVVLDASAIFRQEGDEHAGQHAQEFRDLYSNGAENDGDSISYVDVVKNKLEMLKKLERMRKKTAGEGKR